MLYEKALDVLMSDSPALGRFWLVDGSDDPVDGYVQWDAERGADLKVLQPGKDWRVDENGSTRHVWGVLAGGTPLTLPSAHVSSREIAVTASNLLSATLRTTTLLLGNEGEPEAAWDNATFRTANLHRWLPKTGLSSPVAERHHGSVDWQQPDSVYVVLDDAKLELGVMLETPMGWGPDQVLRTHLNVHVQSATKVSVETLERRYIRPLQALSVVAANRWDDVLFEAVSSTETRAPTLVLRAGRTTRPSQWDLRDGKYLFLGEDCEDVAAVIRRWFRLFDVAGLPITVFGETLRSGSSYFPGRLIGLVTALEGYCDAVLKRGSSYFETLKKMREHAGVSPDVNHCTDENLDLLVHARNYFTHLGTRRPYSAEQLEDALIDCCRWATSLMQSCLLKDLGFSSPKAEALLNDYYQWWPLP